MASIAYGGYGNLFGAGFDFTPKGLGINKSIRDMNDEEYERYSQSLQKQVSRKNRITDIVSGRNSTTTNTAAGATTNTGYDSDWNNSNPNYSWDSMKTMAKDLAQQQLDQSEKMMGLSYGFRTKEKGLDSEIRQREAQQRFGFEEALENLKNNQQLKIQDNQYGQERTMFGLQDTAETNKINSARSAASNLFYGRRNKF